jgi:hypothetical protein
MSSKQEKLSIQADVAEKECRAGHAEAKRAMHNVFTSLGSDEFTRTVDVAASLLEGLGLTIAALVLNYGAGVLIEELAEEEKQVLSG